jgi:hypothetical protein
MERGAAIADRERQHDRVCLADDGVEALGVSSGERVDRLLSIPDPHHPATTPDARDQKSARRGRDVLALVHDHEIVLLRSQAEHIGKPDHVVEVHQPLPYSRRGASAPKRVANRDHDERPEESVDVDVVSSRELVESSLVAVAVEVQQEQLREPEQLGRLAHGPSVLADRLDLRRAHGLTAEGDALTTIRALDDRLASRGEHVHVLAIRLVPGLLRGLDLDRTVQAVACKAVPVYSTKPMPMDRRCFGLGPLELFRAS